MMRSALGTSWGLQCIRKNAKGGCIGLTSSFGDQTRSDRLCVVVNSARLVIGLGARLKYDMNEGWKSF